ncbi:hypothetical protein [Aridibaculum aurantiacum]|uniref:hypothetical protein n=1 Tax=Aridibaculum aurantiacum TaxID=2810307 RepID=UPI001A964D21|nr:hypothetical protein [Aridibaculum aurantiacum]
MKPVKIFSILVLASVFLSGCEVVGDIFKAGMWIGVIIVVIIIAVVLWLLRKIKGR